jgi:hypothetical protein
MPTKCERGKLLPDSRKPAVCPWQWFLPRYCVTFNVSVFGVDTGVPLAPFAEIVME